MILNIGGGGGVKPRIVVTAPTGSDVTVSKGSTILYAPEVSGTWIFNVPEQGDWSATAILGSKTASKTVTVSKVGVYNVTLRYVSATLNDNSWEDIKGIADASEGQNYWAVGDTKQITINGKVSDGLKLSNYRTYVYIIGFDHNKDIEGTGIAFGSFKSTSGNDMALCDSNYDTNATSGQWFNMNNTNANNGGWESSLMRTATIPVIKEALPSDLLDVIKTTVIYTDNVGGSSTDASRVTSTKDDLYLLAEYEVFGVRKFANRAEKNYQQQYAYYAAGNSKIKYRHNTSPLFSVYWWERSVRTSGSTAFCRVSSGGVEGSDSALICYGLSIAFKVGTTPIFPTLNDNSWSAIAKVAYTSEGANYWSVGDTKQITLNGKLSNGLTLSNYKTWVYILGFDHNEAVEGKGIVFGGFKTAQIGGKDVALTDSKYNRANSSGQWFNMNNNNRNSGGWSGCNMRNNILPLVKAAMPSDLQAVLKTTTLYTDNTGGGSDTASYVTATQDNLYLLAEFEIFGIREYANSVEQNYQQQYEYYSSGGRSKKIKYQYNSTSSTVYWWERSLRATTNNEWTYISTDGYQTGGDCNMSFGLAPAFRVCYTPPQPISNLAVGDIVKVKESGIDVDYIIVQQGNPDTTLYDASCDGTWLLRKDLHSKRPWNNSLISTYNSSSINTWLNSDFVDTLNIKNTIKQVKIPYRIDDTSMDVNSGSNGLSVKSFLLGGYELGWTTTSTYISPIPVDGNVLKFFEGTALTDNKRIAYYNGEADYWWTRSIAYTNVALYVIPSGYANKSSKVKTTSYCARPAFILPFDAKVDKDNNIIV